MRSSNHIDLTATSSGGSGVDGLSAYQVALSNGFVGAEAQWLASLVGANGSQGIQGVAGTNGSNGTNGYTPVKGIDYFDGATGPQGPKGDTGLIGPAGSNGADGAQGIQGIQGPAGTNGTNGTNGADGITAVSRAVMTSTQQNTTVTEAGVTQLALAMVANGVYQVNAFITFQSAATTTGAKIGFTSPASCRCMVEVVVPITSTAVASQLRTIFPNAAVATNIGVVIGTGVTAINSNHTARISGIITNGANAGNFQVTFASEVAASAITLQIGSELQLIRIA